MTGYAPLMASREDPLHWRKRTQKLSNAEGREEETTSVTDELDLGHYKMDLEKHPTGLLIRLVLSVSH